MEEVDGEPKSQAPGEFLNLIFKLNVKKIQFLEFFFSHLSVLLQHPDETTFYLLSSQMQICLM